MIRQHRLVLVFSLIVGLIVLVVSLSLYRRQPTSDNDAYTPSKTSSFETRTRSSDQHAKDVSLDKVSEVRQTTAETSKSDSPSASDIPASKLERIRKLYDQLDSEGIHLTGPHPVEIAILTEGMDTLSAARFLKEQGIFDYALEYAERALAENPGSFEVLLLRTQLLPSNREAEREPAFRQLLEMNPNSVEVLVGLGSVLAPYHPSETIQYLQKAIEMAPSYKQGLAYVELGYSYESLGRYDEALAAYQKAYQIYPGQVAGAHIRAIKEGNPIIKPISLEHKEQLPERTSPSPGKTSSDESLQEAIPALTPTEKLTKETGSVEETITERDESKYKDANARHQHLMDELQRMINEYQGLIDQDSTPSFGDDNQIADLERSVESNPNRSDSYLELAKAYEKAGGYEKAASVYQRAMKRFPKDKRVRQEWEDFRNKRSRSTEHLHEKNSDFSKEGSR